MSKPHIKSFRGHHCDAQLESWLKSNHITTYQVIAASQSPMNYPQPPKKSISEWIKGLKR